MLGGRERKNKKKKKKNRKNGNLGEKKNVEMNILSDLS